MKIVSFIFTIIWISILWAVLALILMALYPEKEGIAKALALVGGIAMWLSYSSRLP